MHYLQIWSYHRNLCSLSLGFKTPLNQRGSLQPPLFTYGFVFIQSCVRPTTSTRRIFIQSWVRPFLYQGFLEPPNSSLPPAQVVFLCFFGFIASMNPMARRAVQAALHEGGHQDHTHQGSARPSRRWVALFVCWNGALVLVVLYKGKLVGGCC